MRTPNKQKTGKPEEFAVKLGISTSSLYRFVRGQMERYQIPIKYCRIRKAYYFENPQISLFYALQMIGRRSPTYRERTLKEALAKATKVPTTY